MTILVTGGTGFIGSHTCVELLMNNYNIVVVDSLINSNQEVIKRIKEIIKLKKKNCKSNIFFYKCDLKDENSLRKVFKKQEKNNLPITSVIHFAALKSVFESFNFPILYWENNVGGTINLIKIMKEFNCKNLVFSSSATIYDGSEKNLLKESSRLKPSNPYGFTKLTIENLLNNLCIINSFNWKIISLRYFNPIGAHPTGLIGESPNGTPDNIFPYLCRVASGRYERLHIFGNNWPTKDGTGIRDYIHIKDIAEAHVLALNYIEKKHKGILSLNVGTSLGTSILELINTFEKVNDCKIKYDFVDRRKGDFAEIVADNKLLLKTFGWEPKLNLESMCKDGWNWQKNNPNGYL